MVLNHRLGTQSRVAGEKGRELKEEDEGEQQKVGKEGEGEGGGRSEESQRGE